MLKGKMPRSFWQGLVALLLDNVDEGIHVTDVGGYTLFYNAASARMDGIDRKEAIGKHILEMFPSLKEETSTILHVLHTGTPVFRRDQIIRNMYGRPVYLVSSTLPVMVEGKIVGAVDISKDLTHVKELAEKVLDLQKGLNTRRFHLPLNGEEARFTFADICGEDPAFVSVKEKAMKASRTSSPVLVYGETGSGKELLVQAIHNAGPRGGWPFIGQNCAALPASLLEGILFGTAKGSFTGAENRPGLVELADGGTLFLDEITSLDVTLQSKLLRFIQEGYIRRVGENRIRRVDVRIMASTNIDPGEAVESNLLRADLYYRLNVVTLCLPPLRNRKEDIPILARHFIRECNQKMGLTVTGLSAEVGEAFAGYNWPGNVRELRGVIEGAMNILEGDVIEIAHLPSYLLQKTTRRQEAGPPAVENLPLKDAVEKMEKFLVCSALDRCGGNISRAAKSLGIPRQTLQYKLAALDIKAGRQESGGGDQKPAPVGGVDKGT